MAESTLSITYTEISVRVAHLLGYDRTSTNWSTDQTSDINDAIDSGYRMFLGDHDWHALYKNGTVSLTDSDYDYDLADDFHYLLHHYFTYPADEGRPPIQEVSEGTWREYREQADLDDYPIFFAIRPKSFDGTSGMRHEVVFYPTPNVTKTVTYSYRMLVPQLRTATPYPIGGMRMGEAVLYAALASAELIKNSEYGVNYDYYTKHALPSARQEDNRYGPQQLGPNLDHSDHYRYYGVVHWNNQSTHNGVSP